jgi:hypothetical protein
MPPGPDDPWGGCSGSAIVEVELDVTIELDVTSELVIVEL